MSPHRLLRLLRSRRVGILARWVPVLVLVFGAIPLVWSKIVGFAALPLPVAIAAIPLSVVAALAIAEFQRASALDACLEREPMRISASTPYDVGVKPSLIAQQRYPDEIPPYVGRPATDKRIRDLLATKHLAIVKGLVNAGKTRTAYEAIRRFPDALLLVPDEVEVGTDPLVTLLSTQSLLPPTERYVLFVDDIERRVAGLSLSLLLRWLDAHPGSVVIGTIAAEQCRQLLSSKAPGFKDMRRLLSREYSVTLQDELVGKTLARAQRLYGGSEQDDARVSRLGAFLVSADAVIAHFDASASEVPTAYALALSAINCARAGLTRPIPLERLIRMAREISGHNPDDWGRAYDYCTERIEGETSVLIPFPAGSGPPRLTANSALIEKADLDDAEADRPAALPEKVWRAVEALVAETDADRYAIAVNGLLRGRGEQQLDGDDDEEAVTPDATWKARAVADESDPLREVLEPAARGRRPVPRRPTDEQLAYAEERAEQRPAGYDGPFDPSIPRRRREGFYSHTGVRDVLRTAYLILGDVLGAAAAIAVASTSEAVAFNDSTGLPHLARTTALAAAIVFVFYAMYGLYNRDSERARLRELIKGTSLAAFVVFLIALQRGYELQNGGFVLLAAVAACAFAFMWRWVYDRLSRRWVVRRGLASRVLLLAPAALAASRCRLLHDALRRPAQFVGYLADGGSADDPDWLGTTEQLADKLELAFADRVVIADETLTAHERVELAYRCHGIGRAVETLPSIDELPLGASKALVDYVMPLVEISPLYLSRWHALAKRTTDVVLGVALAPFAMVLVMLVGGLMKARSPREAMLTSGERPGLGGQRGAFRMYRLRTKNHGRKSLVGGFARRLRIDELPQLWNVLRGDMSLVGPRPLTWEEFRRLDLVQRRRYAVKPGITGLWQIARRREIALADMAALDLTYCLRWSPVLDLAILLSTVPAVLVSPARWSEQRVAAFATT